MRDIDPDKFPRHIPKRPKAKPSPKRRRHSLLGYLEKRYRPNHKMAEKTAVYYGSAINKLNAFAGRDVSMGEVTPSLIGKFIDWALADGTIATRTVFEYAKAVADVYRDARSDEYCEHATEWHEVFGKWAVRRHSGEQTLASEVAERYCSEREFHPRYAENVIRAARSIEAFAGSAVVPCGLTTELVTEWLTSLQNGKRTNTTVRQYRAIILGVWNWASDLGMCQPPIARRIKSIKVVTPIPVAWTLPEVLRLLSAVDKLDGMVSETPASLFWGSLCRTAYDTGLRLGDLMAMTPAALHSDLVVIRQSKTGKPLCRRLHPATVAAIEAMVSNGRRLLWPWPHKERMFQKHFHNLICSAELTGTFKYLRRTSGTLVEAAHPGAGPAHLSHSSRKVFEDHYLDFRQTADSLPMPPSLDEPPTNGGTSKGGSL
ncbi:MAG: phage integrase SAM-like domain-containing protein [Planctomycetes bacterium]|nr:phage integrase SAM-like domain-containing protein [Planctomycetota bacterium]